MYGRGGFHPVAVYGTLILVAPLVLVLWAGVAAALSALGPLGSFVLAGLLCVLPLFLSRVRKDRAYRVAAGLCGECGYDIRATVERCPECGSPLAEEVLRRRRWAEGRQRAIQFGPPSGR